jgi:hypothetical protein
MVSRSLVKTASPDTSGTKTDRDDALTGAVSDAATCTCRGVKGPFGEPLIEVCPSCNERMWNALHNPSTPKVSRKQR